jgi:hypothetical protein
MFWPTWASVRGFSEKASPKQAAALAQGELE